MGCKHFLILASLIFVCEVSSGAQFVSWRNYEIHYTTFSSMFIPSEVAVAHDIVRSENSIVLNISVKKSDQSVAASIDGQVTNLLNQLVDLQFREVNDGQAIYYLANHIVDERDILNFHVRIVPTGETEAYKLNFLRQYY